MMENGMEKHAGWHFGLDLAADGKWMRGTRQGFEVRDLGASACTNDNYHAQLGRRNPDEPIDPDLKLWHAHDLDFQMVFVLRGWARFEYEGQGERILSEGDCLHQLPGIKHREFHCSDDYMVLEITSPAKFETRLVDPPEGSEAPK
jgi:hypothetical protein